MAHASPVGAYKLWGNQTLSTLHEGPPLRRGRLSRCYDGGERFAWYLATFPKKLA